MTRRRTSRTIAVLITLAAVLTAGAPSIIRIKSGDSLWAIAHRHGTTVAALRRLNDLPGNGMIYAGELLKVPAAPAPQRRTVLRSYTVRSGDNLTVISRRTHVSIANLKASNHLSRSGMVRVGQRLLWRVTVTTARTSSARTSDTYNAGLRIPAAVQESTARHRAYLRSTHQPSKAEVRRMVYRTAKKNHVDPSLALAVAYHESGFQQGVVSGVDAIGVMQVLPSTGRVIARQYGKRLDLLKAQDNITAGVLLLQQLVRSTGSAEKALAGYYQGLGSVAARGLLPQTRAYVRNVLALRPRFRNG